MNKAPAFQFYAQDFLTGVIYLTNEETGIYIKMLAKQWTDGNIPKKRLGFLVGYDWVNLSDELKAKFSDKGDFIINERLEIEREKKARFLDRQRINGKKGGRPLKNSKPNNNPSLLKKEPKQNPLEVEEEKEEEVINNIDVDFEKFSGNEITAYQYLKNENQELIEVFEMREKKTFAKDNDYQTFINNFNFKVDEEDIEFTQKKLYARLCRMNNNWDKSVKEKKGEELSATQKVNVALGLDKNA